MKINKTNSQEINEKLALIQKKSRVRTIDSMSIQSAIEAIESKLTKLLPKSTWKGIKVIVDVHAQHFPTCYSGSPESTQFTVEYFSDWFITSMDRTYCNSPVNKYRLCLNEVHKQQITEFIIKTF